MRSIFLLASFALLCALTSGNPALPADAPVRGGKGLQGRNNEDIELLDGTLVRDDYYGYYDGGRRGRGSRSDHYDYYDGGRRGKGRGSGRGRGRGRGSSSHKRGGRGRGDSYYWDY